MYSSEASSSRFRSQSPGNAFPSTVYSSIHKKESDLSQLDFLVTLIFYIRAFWSAPAPVPLYLLWAVLKL